jgi:hypothetical protein
MSLDFDRSPDGEPIRPAVQPAVPAQPAPETTEPEPAPAPSFTPMWRAAERAGEPADDEPEYGDDEAELADDETVTAGPAEPEPAPAGRVVSGTVVSETVPDEPAADETGPGEPVAPDASLVPAARVAAGESAGRATGVEPAADLDGPLLSDTDELRASWQRIQAAFVDDPRDAVADAAGLVEHTAQALAGALRQRQRQLRAMWDRDGVPDGVEYADSGGSTAAAVSPGEDRPAAAGGPDTEQLRLLIQRYRVLFNHLARP